MPGSSQVLVLNQTLRPFESIEAAGRTILGVSKATAYRCAEREGWPVVGGHGTRARVNVVALCEKLGLPFEVITDCTGGDR